MKNEETKKILEKEIKKYIDINNKISIQEQEKKTTHEQYKNTYYFIQELKEQNKTQEEQETLLKEQEEKNLIIEKQEEEQEKELNCLLIEKQLIRNNIIIMFKDINEEQVKEIFNKYKNKNIGEKTRQKISEEITQATQQKNYTIKCYFNNVIDTYSSNLYTINFYIFLDKEQNYYKAINFDITIYNINRHEEEKKLAYIIEDHDTKKNIYNSNITEHTNNYIYIKDTRNTSKTIIKAYNINKMKFDKLKEQLATIRKENNNFIDNYKLKYNIMQLDYNITLY